MLAAGIAGSGGSFANPAAAARFSTRLARPESAPAPAPALPDYQGKRDGKTANNQGNDTDSTVEYDIKQLVQPTVEFLRLGFYFRQEFLKPGIYF